MKKESSKPTISALIIAKNEEEMIEQCTNTLQWCNEILVLDDGSTDRTQIIAEKLGAKVFSQSYNSFSRKREELARRAVTDWIFYVDADERVVPTLAKEVMVLIETSQGNALKFRRNNIYYGRRLKYGGWGNDYVTRAFKREALEGWSGEIHESAKFAGSELEVKTPLIHLTHRDTVSGLIKTTAWTPMEAKALYEAEIPRVGRLTIIRKGLMEFLRRFIFKKGYKEGQVGFIESLIQGMNKALIYIQVWELQQSPSIREKYQNVESEIQKLWQDKES